MQYFVVVSQGNRNPLTRVVEADDAAGAAFAGWLISNPSGDRPLVRFDGRLWFVDGVQVSVTKREPFKWVVTKGGGGYWKRVAA